MVQVGLPKLDVLSHPIYPWDWVAGRELEIFGSHGCVFQDFPEVIYYSLFLQSGQLDPKQLIKQEATLEEGVQALKLQSCRHSYDHTIFLPQTSLIITKSAMLAPLLEEDRTKDSAQ
jgi:hypothetical protein